MNKTNSDHRRIVPVTNWSKAPFDSYLLVQDDVDSCCEAMEILPDDTLDIDTLLRRFLTLRLTDWEADGWKLETLPSCGGSRYAAIYTDGRAPDSPIVWATRDFYLTAPDDADWRDAEEDSPTVENCDDWGTGEGKYHGRI